MAEPEWLEEQAGQHRFGKWSEVVSIGGMRWAGVLLRLTPKPSVRFVSHIMGSTHLILRKKTEQSQMSRHHTSLSYVARREY